MINSALIPVGGIGSRMRSIGKLPKLLLPIGPTTLLGLCILRLKLAGITDFYFTTKDDCMEVNSYISNFCSDLSINKVLLKETVLGGNFGGIVENIDVLPDEFVVAYPDVVTNLDFRLLFLWHQSAQADITFVVRKSDHLHDSDQISLDSLNRINSLYSKEIKNVVNSAGECNLYGNCGIYIIKKPLIINVISSLRISTGEVDLFSILSRYLLKSKIFLSAFTSADFILDVGTPERYMSLLEKVEASGLDSFFNRNYNKMLLLDRDGTLIKSVSNGYLYDATEVVLNPQILDAYKSLTESNFIPVVLTNQPQISFGKLTYAALDSIHSRIQRLLVHAGLKEIYRFIHCPHHPHSGHKNELNHLKFKCICRKPSTGMFSALKQTVNIDTANSIMVGDTINDESFAKAIGSKYYDINNISVLEF